jgi:hypothetical protein
MNKQLLPRIADLFELLRKDGTYLAAEFDTKDDQAAASDLFEHDNMICIAAYKILNGFATLHAPDKAALEEPILFGTRLLKLRDRDDPDSTWEIAHLEHVLRYARSLEELRQVCLRCMQEP